MRSIKQQKVNTGDRMRPIRHKQAYARFPGVVSSTPKFKDKRPSPNILII